MNFCLGNKKLTRGQERLITLLHWLVLIASGALIVWITRDTLNGVPFFDSPSYRNFQLWMCLLFQIDILIEWWMAPRKWHYVWRNAFFILVSIPYLNIISFSGLHLSSQAMYLFSFVPMIRAGFIFAIIVGALTSSRVLSTFYVYLIWVIASLFFASLMFYEGEHYINPQVDTWWTALWWACMSMTTAGCNIEPVTMAGNVLEVLLSAEGMMLIPVFTVYITRAVLGASDGADGTAGTSTDGATTDAGQS